MKNFCLFVFSFVALAAVASAEDKKIVYLEVSDGVAGYLALNDKINTLVVWTKSKGNLTLPFEFIGTLPPGSTFKASASTYRKPEKEFLIRKENFWPVALKDTSQIAKERENCIELGLGDKDDVVIPKKDPPTKIPVTPDFNKDLYCKLYDWSQLLQLGVDCYPKKLFGKIEGRAGNITSEYFDRYGVLRKDACGSSKIEYVVRIDVDLSQVPHEVRDGFTASLRIKTFPYEGKRRASLKPKSDGRYKPKPIILMEWLNGLCGNELSMSKFRAGRLVSTVKLPLYTFYLHRDDLILGIAVADKVLKGGWGTFELSDGYQSYGVCMELVRRRQKVNGY